MNKVYIILKDNKLSKVIDTKAEVEKGLNLYYLNTMKEIIHVYDEQNIALNQLEILTEQNPESKFTIETYYKVLEEIDFN